MRKNKIAYWLSVCMFLGTLLLFGWIYYPLLSSSHVNIVSPIPSFLSLQKNIEVTTLDLWKPFVEAFEGVSAKEPIITGSSAMAYDITSEKVLFQKNPTKKLPFASLTKIMTAIVALEHKKPDDEYVVSSSDLVGEDSMGLSSGEVLSLKELLHGMILHSGNDAAEVLADNYSSGREAFVTAMNQKAVALGLANTHFTNPTGLEGDGDQYTTAADLVVITRFALDNFPDFTEVAKTVDYTIDATSTHKAFYLENETNLLTSYPGVEGVKTGYTPEAGLCLVTYLHYKGHRIIAVLLGSENRRDEMKQILDYSLKNLGITPPPHG